MPLSHLKNIRQSLLQLHKTLLEEVKIDYERAHGRVRSTGEFYQLVTGHDWFAWLHPLSLLIVEMDELMDAERNIGKKEIEALTKQAQAFFHRGNSQMEFTTKFFDLLERSPKVILSYAEVSRLLKNK